MIDWQFSLYAITLLFTAIFAALISYFAWQRRGTTGRRTLAYLMLAILIWAITNLFELIASGESYKISWSKITYIGIHSTPPLFLILALQYSQRERWLRRRNIVLLWVIPIIIVVLAATNEYHHLIWADFSWHPTDSSVLVYHYGPGFWLGAGYGYLLFLFSAGILVWAALNLPAIYRGQVTSMLLASLILLIGNILYVTKSTLLSDREIIPITFLIAGIPITWSIFRHQLLDITPIARSKLVDIMRDAVIVVDHQLRIGDLNPAAQSLLTTAPNQTIGQPAYKVLGRWPYLESHFRAQPNKLSETETIQDKRGNWYEAQISPLRGQREQIEGWLIALKDITQQRELEAALRASEELYRNVTETANDGIVIIQENIVKYCNPQLACMIGYHVDEIIGKPFMEFIAPDQALKIQERHNRRVEGEPEPSRYESEVRHSSGQIVPVEFNVSIMEYNGEPAILAIVRDHTEKSQAEKELYEYTRQQILLNDIIQAAIQTTEIDTALQILADRLGELFYADGCIITLWDPIEEVVIPAAAYGASSKDFTNSKFDPEEPSVTKAVLQQERPIIIEDTYNTPHLDPKRAAEFSAKSLLALPLIANNQKLGGALIAFNEPHTFTDEEVYLGEQASRQISLAVLKDRLLDTARQRAREAETLRQAGAAVAATLQLDEAIERILEQLHEVVPYDSASVQLLRDDELEIVGLHGFDDPDKLLGMSFPITEDNPNRVIIQTRQSHIIKDAPKVHSTFNEAPHNHIRGWLGVPLIVQDRINGMLALDSHQPDRFNSEHARLATAFAAQVAIALENARLYEEARRLAIIDPLTGIYNRRHFMALALQEHQRARRYERPLSIIMIDIDHFKRVNDTYGHLIGDQVLRTVASSIHDNLRETDFVGRYGGEEFVVLLPETPGTVQPTDPPADNPNDGFSAKLVAQRLCKLIQNTTIQTEEGTIQVTVSLGVAGQSWDFIDIETLLDRADTALYVAKQRGRNQVAVWSDSM